jgi:hypothetical protein
MATLEACKGKVLVVFAIFLLSATRNVKICYSQACKNEGPLTDASNCGRAASTRKVVQERSSLGLPQGKAEDGAE